MSDELRAVFTCMAISGRMRSKFGVLLAADI